MLTLMIVAALFGYWLPELPTFALLTAFIGLAFMVIARANGQLR